MCLRIDINLQVHTVLTKIIYSTNQINLGRSMSWPERLCLHLQSLAHSKSRKCQTYHIVLIVTHEKAICAVSCSCFDLNEVFWFGFIPNDIQVAKPDKQSGQVAIGVRVDDVGCLGLIPRGHTTVIGVDCH
jgi:hypothetical protein